MKCLTQWLLFSAILVIPLTSFCESETPPRTRTQVSLSNYTTAEKIIWSKTFVSNLSGKKFSFSPDSIGVYVTTKIPMSASSKKTKLKLVVNTNKGTYNLSFFSCPTGSNATNPPNCTKGPLIMKSYIQTPQKDWNHVLVSFIGGKKSNTDEPQPQVKSEETGSAGQAM